MIKITSIEWVGIKYNNSSRYRRMATKMIKSMSRNNWKYQMTLKTVTLWLIIELTEIKKKVDIWMIKRV